MSFRILQALETYSQTADHGVTNRTEIITSLIALDVRDVSETTDVIGFGSRTGSDTLTNGSLVYYRDGDTPRIDQSDAAIFLSDEVMDRAKEAHGKGGLFSH